MRRRTTPFRTGIMCAVLIAVVFVGVQLTAVTGRDSPDSKNYISYALSLSGESRTSATAHAIDYVCADQAERPPTWIPWSGNGRPTETPRECVRRLTASAAYWTRQGNTSGMTGPFLNSRFMAIYEARPGYPLLLVPFIAAFGLVWGIWLAGVTVAVAGSLCVLAALRTSGATRPAALTGQALYLTLPTGATAMRPMADGLTMACTAGVVLGCALTLNGKRRAGTALVVGGLLSAFLARYSQALLLAAVLTGAFAGLAWYRKRHSRPTRPALGLFALCGVLTIVMQTTTHVLGWPTGQDSAQDLLTHHYRRPDVASPWTHFIERELTFWPAWLQHQLTHPELLIALALAAWALVRRPAVLGLLASATALSGLLNQAGHPNLAIMNDYRLIVLVWFLPILVIPLLTAARGHGAGRLREDGSADSVGAGGVGPPPFTGSAAPRECGAAERRRARSAVPLSVTERPLGGSTQKPARGTTRRLHDPASEDHSSMP
ncbi:hypothetical protein PUR49_04395 [Streptomyces sp. BE147]|uniref:hypothetical protein n=1 Tax=Streptomyces sp. BE147 TaxID=3002524 RepID=UPI002E78C0A7|nr:hypothetical protein [Streptomyces sp. BE147]MEE1735760.1 hypothetical protein [Streptomyces sp. BE147]